MARFGDNPLKDPLAGNERIPFTDVSGTGNGADGALTPDILAGYLLGTLPLATDTGNGLMSATDHVRLYDTYTQAEVDAFNAIFKQEAIGIYIGTCADGYLEFFANVLAGMTVISATVRTASGTVTVAVQIDGVSVTGLDAIAASSTAASATATAANALANGGKVGVNLSANSAALGLYVTILCYKQ